MSYDLSFRYRTAPAPGAPDGFLPYFAERPHYRCTDNQAPRRLLRKKEDTALFRWAELERLASRFPRESDGALPAYRLFYDEPPEDVAQAYRAKPTNAEPIKGINFDEILDQELIDRAR